jgi:uncharacterized protein (TIGR00730 family)
MAKKKVSRDEGKWPEKAYKNLDFLTSPEGRTLRILAEFLEPATRFRRQNVWNTVVFFGSARIPPPDGARANVKRSKGDTAGRGRLSQDLENRRQRAERDLLMSRYYEDAEHLAEKITRWSLGIREEARRFHVCSGGGAGIMEAANRGARKAGGKSIGLNISLPFEQAPNRYLDRDLSFEFHYFFIRKFWFFYLAKALVAFPGGFGTLDELFELLTLVQTRKTRKVMPIIIYGREYWERVLNFDALLEWGAISPEDLGIFRFFDDVESAFAYLKNELTRLYLRKTRAEGPVFPTPP